DPPDPPVLAEGFDPCSIPAAELLRAYDLATATPRFTRETVTAGSDDTSPMLAPYARARDGLDSVALRSYNSTISSARPAAARAPPGCPRVPRHRPPPRARRAGPALHDPPPGPRARRDRGGRALPPRPLDRAQRGDRVRPHPLLHRPGGPLRLRDKPRE